MKHRLIASFFLISNDLIILCFIILAPLYLSTFLCSTWLRGKEKVVYLWSRGMVLSIRRTKTLQTYQSIWRQNAKHQVLLGNLAPPLGLSHYFVALEFFLSTKAIGSENIFQKISTNFLTNNLFLPITPEVYNNN